MVDGLYVSAAHFHLYLLPDPTTPSEYHMLYLPDWERKCGKM